MPTLTPIPIRARITFPDDEFEVETPYILSFNVSKTRNSPSSFNASVKVKGDTLNRLTSNLIIIEAGELDALKKIFTGYILQATPSPCWEDPTYVILNISGSDILHRMQGEKFTRRQITSFNKWALITGVAQKTKKGAQFMLANKQTLNSTEDFQTDEQKAGKDKPPVDASTTPQHTTSDRKNPPDVTVSEAVYEEDLPQGA